MSTNDTSAIIVFGRIPLARIPAKTRLGAQLGNTQLAREMGHFLTRKTLSDFSAKHFSDFRGKRYFCFGGEEYIGDEEREDIISEFSEWNFFPQEQGKDVRGMKDAFEHVFSQGHDRVVLIGTDIVGLDGERLLSLLESLRHFDVCLQPLEDDGYGAIGMRRCVDLFSTIENFTSHSEGYHLIRETEQLCTRQQCSLFVHPDVLFDIDHRADVETSVKNSDLWKEFQQREALMEILQHEE